MGDDGFYGTIYVTFQPTCAVPPGANLPIRYLWDFAPIPQLTGSGSYPTYRVSRDSIRHHAPSISVNPVIQTVQGIHSTVDWEIGIQNASNRADAANAWFSLFSPSGDIVVADVTDLATSTSITPVNGMYQLGTHLRDSVENFRITAHL